MPHVLAREDAIREAVAEAGDCVACALVAGQVEGAHVLAATRDASLILPRMGVRWGHALVLLREHVTSFEALAPEVWLDAAGLAHRAARAMERALAPARVFVASLGAPEPAPAMTTPHLHLHVIPLARSEKPSEVLTWERGVVVGSTEERDELARRLRALLAL